MKTWDPLSVFKYVTGSPTIHLTIFMILAYTEPYFEIANNPIRSLYDYDKGPDLYKTK